MGTYVSEDDLPGVSTFQIGDRVLVRRRYCRWPAAPCDAYDHKIITGSRAARYIATYGPLTVCTTCTIAVELGKLAQRLVTATRDLSQGKVTSSVAEVRETLYELAEIASRLGVITSD